METKKLTVITDKQAKSLYQSATVVIAHMRLEAEGMAEVIRTLSDRLEASEKVILGLRSQLAAQEVAYGAKKAFSRAEKGVIVAQAAAITEMTKLKFDLPRDQRKIF